MSTGLTIPAASPFDAIRRTDEGGQEYWSARELMPLLGYERWERFEDAIERAAAAITNSGEGARDHIRGAAKIVKTGIAERKIIDYCLTRYGSYMVAMNSDPRKAEVAEAQTYFAVRTREAETARPALTEDQIIAQALQITTRRVEVLETRVAELTPPAQAWEHLASTDGDLSCNDAAKIISRDPAITIGEGRLWKWLDQNGWTYRDPSGDRRAYQRYIESGHLTARARGHHHPGTGEWVVDAPQIRFTMRGIELIRRRLAGTSGQLALVAS